MSDINLQFSNTAAQDFGQGGYDEGARLGYSDRAFKAIDTREGGPTEKALGTQLNALFSDPQLRTQQLAAAPRLLEALNRGGQDLNAGDKEIFDVLHNSLQTVHDASPQARDRAEAFADALAATRTRQGGPSEAGIRQELAKAYGDASIDAKDMRSLADRVKQYSKNGEDLDPRALEHVRSDVAILRQGGRLRDSGGGTSGGLRGGAVGLFNPRPRSSGVPPLEFRGSPWPLHRGADTRSATPYFFAPPWTAQPSGPVIENLNAPTFIFHPNQGDAAPSPDTGSRTPFDPRNGGTPSRNEPRRALPLDQVTGNDKVALNVNLDEDETSTHLGISVGNLRKNDSGTA